MQFTIDRPGCQIRAIAVAVSRFAVDIENPEATAESSNWRPFLEKLSVRTVHMASARRHRRAARCRAIDPIQDAALGHCVRRRAARTQRLEVSFQRAQFAYARGDMADVLVEQRIDLTAVLLGCIAEPDQRANLIQRHVEIAALADEGQVR